MEETPQNDEVSLKELILKLREWNQYLLSKWKIIVLMGVIGGILGFAYAYFKKAIYTAESIFVLDDSSGGGGGLGQYAGLASMVGINIGGSSDGLFHGNNLFELYKSRLMLEKTLLSRTVLEGKSQLLVERFIEINHLKKKWEDNPRLKNLDFSVPQNKYTLGHYSALKIIEKDINDKYLTVESVEKASLVNVSVESTDELFSKVFNDKLVENVNAYYIQTRTKKTLDNLKILQYQADSVRKVLNNAMAGTASALDANPNMNTALQVLRVPSQKKQVDLQTSSAIYAEIVKNIELTQISLRNESPLIQIVDKPQLPLDKAVAGKLKYTFLVAFLMIFLTSFMLLGKKIFLNIIN